MLKQIAPLLPLIILSSAGWAVTLLLLVLESGRPESTHGLYIFVSLATIGLTIFTVIQTFKRLGWQGLGQVFGLTFLFFIGLYVVIEML